MPTDPAPGRRPLRPVQVVLVVVVLVVALVVGDRVLGTPDRQRATPAVPTPSTSASTTSALGGCSPGSSRLARCGPAPRLRAITRWFNSPGVDLAGLRGHVVLLDFFSYACGACRRDQSYLTRWASTYRSSGLRVIGIQSPQWSFERTPGNVAAGVRELGIDYPVGLDADGSTDAAYGSTSRPAKYLLDETGTVRAIAYGAGGYQRTEAQLRMLLRAAHPARPLPRHTALLPPDESDGQSAEIAFGSARPPGYTGGPRLMVGRAVRYSYAARLEPSQFTLDGEWTAGEESLLAGDDAHLRIAFATMRASLVAAGNGTVRVHERDRPTRTVRISGNPGPRLLFTGRLDLGVPVTFDVSPGLRLYALSVR